MKIGRPTRYTKKHCQTAMEMLSKGYSKEALAGELGISRQCLYEWIAKYKDFGDTVGVGETKAQYLWEELGMRATLGQIASFNTSVWMFVMKNRFGWKDRQEAASSEDRTVNLRVISYAKALKEIDEK